MRLATITTGKYADRTGTVESNVYQKTVDYPDERANGYNEMLNTSWAWAYHILKRKRTT